LLNIREQGTGLAEVVGLARNRLLHRTDERVTIVVERSEELLVRRPHHRVSYTLYELRIVGLVGTFRDGPQMAAVDEYNDIGWHCDP
jgi:hypothetical protein